MKEIGDLGEQLLARWLELQDYEILQRNWRCRWGEIDIVARDPKSATVAFVEVKTRRDRNWDLNGLLAIDSSKQQKLVRAASLFLTQQPQLAEMPCRFDIGLVGYQFLNPKLNKINTKSDSTPKSIAEIERINHLKIARVVEIGSYRLMVREYIQAAFD